MDLDRPSTVQFSYTHPQRPLRLLELPPDILALVENPTSPPFKLKSRTTPPTANPSDRSYDAVLCTADKTYTVRQVHSSNTGFIVRPTESGNGVTAVSTVGSVLELLPATPDAKGLIRPHLKMYEGWEEGDTVAAAGTTEKGEETWSKAKLMGEVPASDAEFNAAWTELLAFEHAGALWSPTPGVCLKALRIATTAALAEGSNLQKPVTVKRICEAVDDEDIPKDLIECVVRRVSDEVDDGKLTVNAEKCCRFAGGALLEDWWEQGKKRKQNDLMYMSFMMKWKCSVPDFCMDQCKIGVLKGLYTLPTSNTIRFTPPAEAGTSLPIRNKWHEEFRKK